MEKMKMQTPDGVEMNLDRIAQLFPGCITETRDEKGNVKRAVDFDLLRQELSADVVEGPVERYQLNWPGKRQAVAAANAPINKTLRPCWAESVNFDTTGNLYIEGDNLDALKLLQETYLGKVKMIYIDPPYNTGNDFIYKDNFTADKEAYEQDSGQRDEEGGRLVANPESNGRYHSDWLSMMLPRLRLARNLLREDGVLILSIDENEHVNIVKLSKEVFGDDNFCGEIVWKNSSKNDQKYISIQHEYLVFFVKNKAVNKGDWTERKEGLAQIYDAFDGFRKKHGNDWNSIHEEALAWYKQFPESNPIYSSKHYSWMDERGVYFPDNISGPNDGQYVYDVIHPVINKPCKQPSTGWRYPESTMKERIADNLVHFGEDESTVPNNKTYLKNTEFQSLTSMRFVDGRSASKRLTSLFGDKMFTNPKDEFLLKDIFKAVGLKGADVVLDFFAGSGSTFHAVMELNREQDSQCRTILVQLDEDLHELLKTAKGSAKKVTANAIKFLKDKGLPQNVSELGKERIRRAGKKIIEDLEAKQKVEAREPDLLSQQSAIGNKQSVMPDVGFRVLKIDSSNMKDVWYTPDQIKQHEVELFTAHIKEDRTAEDLLFQIMLDWGSPTLDAKIRTEKVGDKTVFIVNDNDILACFEQGITEELVKQMTAFKPLRAVFRDDAFDDSLKINVEQIFKVLSPGTEVKSI